MPKIRPKPLQVSMFDARNIMAEVPLPKKQELDFIVRSTRQSQTARNLRESRPAQSVPYFFETS